MKKCSYVVALGLIVTGCASKEKKVIVDSSANRPAWVDTTKITWAEGDQVFFKQEYSVRSDERLNGCYQLAKLEAKESLVREIAEELKGQIDNAQQSLSESAELVLSQVRSSEYGGKVTGMRFLEQFHERSVVNQTERLDCFVLGSVKKSDYESIKRQILYKVSEADPDVKKAIKERSVKFFTGQFTEPKAEQKVEPKAEIKVVPKSEPKSESKAVANSEE